MKLKKFKPRLKRSKIDFKAGLINTNALKNLTAESFNKSYKLLTPKIGELIDFTEEQNFSEWFNQI